MTTHKPPLGEDLRASMLDLMLGKLSYDAIYDEIHSSRMNIHAGHDEFLRDPVHAAKVLESANVYGFSYSGLPHNLCVEASQFVDFMTNRVIVRHAIGALIGMLADGHLTTQQCKILTENSRARNKSVVVEQFTNTVADTIDMQAQADGKPIIYAAIGCGDGSSDVPIVRNLRERYHGRELRVVGFDAYQSEEAVNFIRDELGGAMIYSPVEKEKGYLSAIEHAMSIGGQEAIVIASAIYVFHHLACTEQKFLQDMRGMDVVMAEQFNPAPDPSLDKRIAVIAADVIMNYAFRPGWLRASMENPDHFAVLYLDQNRDLKTAKVQEFQQTIPPHKIVVQYP